MPSLTNLPSNNENSFLYNVPSKISKNDFSALLMPKKKTIKKRTLPNSPFKVLDAPYLQDDFYLNVVDWCKNDTLAVGLANTIYTWDFSSGNVTKLVEYKDYELASSLSWDIGGEKLVVGSVLGKV